MSKTKCFAVCWLTFLIGLLLGAGLKSVASRYHNSSGQYVQAVADADFVDGKEICDMQIGECGYEEKFAVSIDKDSKVWIRTSGTVHASRDDVFLPIRIRRSSSGYFAVAIDPKDLDKRRQQYRWNAEDISFLSYYPVDSFVVGNLPCSNTD
jgi:hypothetical protein